MRKAFTLAEILITLTIIGILSTMTIGIISYTKPNKDKIYYKKALYSVTKAMDVIISDLENTNYGSPGGDVIFPDSEAYFASSSANENTLCEQMARVMNANNKSCSAAGSYQNPNFITSDGIRFWNVYGKFNSGLKTIRVDRELNSKELSRLSLRQFRQDSNYNVPGLEINIYSNGNVVVPENNYLNKIVGEGFDLK